MQDGLLIPITLGVSQLTVQISESFIKIVMIDFRGLIQAVYFKWWFCAQDDIVIAQVISTTEQELQTAGGFSRATRAGNKPAALSIFRDGTSVHQLQVLIAAPPVKNNTE